MVNLTLPYPPSVNHYWKKTRNGRVYISKEGKDYKAKVFVDCLHIPVIKPPVEINVSVYFPDNRKRDLDNLGKVLFDSLVDAKVLADDCWQVVPKITWESKGIDKHNPRLEIEIKEVNNDK